MNTSKKIAIALWIFQAIALFGCFVGDDSYLDYNLFNWIGFFIPTLIGFGLWFGKDNKKKD